MDDLSFLSGGFFNLKARCVMNNRFIAASGIDMSI